MKLTAQVKLRPKIHQLDALNRTLQAANRACNYASEVAWETKTFRQFNLHKVVYYDLKERFNLSAQMVVRIIAKVADAYKLDKETKRTFKTTGGIAYDNRILSWNLEKSTVSIWTLSGRLTIPFVCGPRQRELLKTQRGESDLILFKGDFYLLTTCDVDEPSPKDIEDVLGVDLGIVNIAVDSDGQRYSGAHLNNLRRRRRKQRKVLQKVGTKSAKRKLKKLSGKERRFATAENHRISKQIVKKAKDTNRAIAMENLTGIRSRITVRKSQRDNLHSWAFYQLGEFTEYKARLEGVPKLPIDPRNSSRECAVCGCIDKRNRKSQSIFLCIACQNADHADDNASKVLRNRGRVAVNLPIISVASAIVSPKMGMVVVN